MKVGGRLEEERAVEMGERRLAGREEWQRKRSMKEDG